MALLVSYHVEPGAERTRVEALEQPRARSGKERLWHLVFATGDCKMAEAVWSDLTRDVTERVRVRRDERETHRGTLFCRNAPCGLRRYETELDATVADDPSRGEGVYGMERTARVPRTPDQVIKRAACRT